MTKIEGSRLARERRAFLKASLYTLGAIGVAAAPLWFWGREGEENEAEVFEAGKTSKEILNRLDREVLLLMDANSQSVRRITAVRHPLNSIPETDPDLLLRAVIDSFVNSPFERGDDVIKKTFDGVKEKDEGSRQLNIFGTHKVEPDAALIVKAHGIVFSGADKATVLATGPGAEDGSDTLMLMELKAGKGLRASAVNNPGSKHVFGLIERIWANEAGKNFFNSSQFNREVVLADPDNRAMEVLKIKMTEGQMMSSQDVGREESWVAVIPAEKWNPFLGDSYTGVVKMELSGRVGGLSGLIAGKEGRVWALIGLTNIGKREDLTFNQLAEPPIVTKGLYWVPVESLVVKPIV